MLGNWKDNQYWINWRIKHVFLGGIDTANARNGFNNWLTNADKTTVEGALIIADPARAAIDKESLPPSTATPSWIMDWQRAEQASTNAASSPGSLAGHIQLPKTSLERK